MTFLRSVLFKYFIYLFILFILDQKGKTQSEVKNLFFSVCSYCHLVASSAALWKYPPNL